MAPNTWPGWETVKPLGKGSYGYVYEIKKTDFGHEYHSALKVIEIPQNDYEVTVLLEGGVRNTDSADRYFYQQAETILNEVQLMASLQGVTNIVSYEDHMIIPKEESIGYYILIRMELLTPLGVFMENHPVDEELIVKLGSDICNALAYCESNNIIHRDIKPGNIFINRFGDFKLGDFGIARSMSSANSVMTQRGTERYMAPEIYQGGHYGFQVDIYSLGLVLYQYLNENRPPFCEKDDVTYYDYQNSQKRRIRGDPIPAPLHGSKKLQEVVLRAIEFDPSKRYSAATEFGRALQEALAQQESKENGNTSGSETRSFAENRDRTKRNIAVVGVIGTAVICLIVLSVAVLLNSKSKTTQEQTIPAKRDVTNSSLAASPTLGPADTEETPEGSVEEKAVELLKDYTGFDVNDESFYTELCNFDENGVTYDLEYIFSDSMDNYGIILDQSVTPGTEFGSFTSITFTYDAGTDLTDWSVDDAIEEVTSAGWKYELNYVNSAHYQKDHVCSQLMATSRMTAELDISLGLEEETVSSDDCTISTDVNELHLDEGGSSVVQVQCDGSKLPELYQFKCEQYADTTYEWLEWSDEKTCSLRISSKVGASNPNGYIRLYLVDTNSEEVCAYTDLFVYVK